MNHYYSFSHYTKSLKTEMIWHTITRSRFSRSCNYIITSKWDKKITKLWWKFIKRSWICLWHVISQFHDDKIWILNIEYQFWSFFSTAQKWEKSLVGQDIFYLPYAHHYNPRLVLFYPIFEDNFFVFKGFFQKILSSCMVSIQEQFLIKIGLWWRAYSIWNSFWSWRK